MTIARRVFLGLAGALAAPSLLRAQAQSITLKLHHALPPISNAHLRLLVPWAKKIQAAAENRIRIELFGAMQLGGTPVELYDQARDGLADIVWTQPGATPGRFASIEVFELPFVAARRATANAAAVQEFAEAHAKEFDEVRLLGTGAHDHGLLHTAKPIRKLEDLKGLRLCAPTRFAGEALHAFGAAVHPVSMAQLSEALSQKALDGCLLPWEAVPAAKVHELAKGHTETSGSPTLCAGTFILAMNKARYASLAPDLKKVLDDNSGPAFVSLAGAMWDEQAKVVEAMVKQRGNTVTALAAEEVARWRKATEPVTNAWIKHMKEKGLDGGKLIESASALIAKYDKA